MTSPQAAPLSRSDLKTGDIIVEVNGKPVSDANQLRLMIGMMPADANVKMKVLRDGKPHEVDVKLGEFPSKEERASVNKETPSESALDGVKLENVTPEVAHDLKLPESTKGVVVDEVSPASPAADAGLRPGDVIQQANHQHREKCRRLSQSGQYEAEAGSSPVACEPRRRYAVPLGVVAF